MKGNSFAGTHIEDWEDGRMFIGGYIHKDGTILDIGCANGFFLLCLQGWSGRTLEPYGIDIDTNRIREAKKIFKAHKDNFIERNALEISKLPFPFPEKFDTVFWSVWVNWEFKLSQEIKALHDIVRLVKPGGRCVMGFYDGEKKSIKQIQRIQELGVRLVRPVKNPAGVEILSWVDVPRSR